MSKQAQQIETVQDRILASRKMLKPGDAHFKGYDQYAGKNPTPNPRIDRNNVRLIYQLVNKITYSPIAYTQNAIVVKNGKVGQIEIPGLLHHVNYVIIRQPDGNRLYALPYRVEQLLRNEKSDITIELYKNEEGDAKTIINIGNAEAMIDSMTDSPAWIAINNCDPFRSENELEKLQLNKPLMQYIKTKKQRYIAATGGYGQELASDGYTALHSNKWDYCLSVDPFHYVKGDAIGTTKPITFETIRNLMPRYGVSDLLLELTYSNNQMPLLQKNRNEYTVMIGEMGIDLKSPERGDIQMPPHVSIVPPRMKAPYLEMPENFIQALSFIVNKSKKHVQDITFRIFKHNDPRCYYIQASGDLENTYQVTCIVETKLTKEEAEAAKAEATKAQAEKESRWKAQDEEEEAARNLGKEEREQVIREAQERLKAEEAAALQERLKAEQEEVARIRAEKAKPATPADNYATAMAIIANPKNLAINYLPTYEIPKPRPNAEQWEIDAYIAQRYLRTMKHFLSSMIFYRDDIAGFQWRTTYILSNAHRDTFRKHFPSRPLTTNHESYIKHLNMGDKAVFDTTVFAMGSGVITYRNGKEYVFKFEEVEPASPEILAALSLPVQYNPGLAGIVEMENEPMPEAIDSSELPITHPVYPEAKIENSSDITKVITSRQGNIIAVIEEHDITDFTPTFTAPSILDEFDDTTAIVPVKPTTLPELPAVIEEVIEEVIDTPKARIDYLQDEQALSQLLATLSQIVGINVMLVGTWLWIDGDTKPVKEQLKQLGFRWHSQKKKWYMSLSGEYFKTRKKTYFIDIAMKYGVRTLKTND